MKWHYFRSLDGGPIIRTDSPSTWENDRWEEIKPRTEGARLHRAQSIKELRKILRPGDTVHCIIRHVSRSGMCRHIDLYKAGRNGTYLTAYAADALEWSQTNKGHGPLIVGGCGMDMCFHTVYSLSRVIFGGPKGWRCPGKGCGSNEHVNSPRVERKRGLWHKGDAGYALRHSTI